MQILIVFRESPENDIVRIEVGVRYGLDGVDVRAVYPNRVLTRIGSTCRFDDDGVESNLFGFLAEAEISVHILQAVDTIFSRCDAFDGELPAAVGAGDASEGLCRKGTIG